MIPLNITRAAEDALRALSRLSVLGRDTEAEVYQSVLSSVTIMESYVDTIVSAIVEDSLEVGGGAIGGVVFDELRPDLQRSWARRNHWLQRLFGISMKGQECGQDGDLVIALRNALTHGSGGMSRLQTQDAGGVVELAESLRRKLRVDYVGGRLFLDASSGQIACSVSREYVLSLDSQLSPFSTKAAKVRLM
ncbi:hypothetical protein [Oerskovia sp. Root22]|uniref:hypothetical protein n=1 Tax=Oerskovia sp. Root22 TaxID=1736494 RepID=UPI0012F73267|nr:hypothetical protein [Oerskovia sp. Root22]